MTARQPFAAERYTLLEASRQAPEVALLPMVEDDAQSLGRDLAAIDPWARFGLSAARFAAFLAATEDGAVRFKIIADTERAGAVVVRYPWLGGPYLNILGVLPPFQGRGIGAAVLDWLEAEAHRAAARNTWLYVAGFNGRARALYERNGYRFAARLEDLVMEGEDEILMRKRLTRPDPA
jgi:diamine N-acetyltransferase